MDQPHPHTKEASSQPRVACILLWYPLFTQPFIFREIEGIKDLLPCEIFTLYGLNLSHCSAEMRACAASVHSHGLRALPRVLAALAKELCTQPRRFFHLLRTHLVRRWPSLEIFGENCWAFCMAFALAKSIDKAKIDVLYAPWPRGTAQTAWVLSSLLNIPYVMTVRGDNLLPADPDLAEKMRDAARIRTNNAADVPRIEAFGQGEAKGKTHLIYNCLTLPTTACPRPAISTYTPTRPLKLLALGRFDTTKGFDDLLDACAILGQKGCDFTLTLAGGGGIAFGLGGLEGMLLAKTKALGLSDRVHFPGLISHSELPNILKQHDIFLVPCVIDKDGRRDGIPNTLLEAMSFGLPVIATKIHALPEVVRDHETGLLVPPHAPSALAEAVLTLAKDTELAVQLGANAYALTKKLFDPASNAKAVANLLLAASCKNEHATEKLV